MILSRFADNIKCQYCYKPHATKRWPANGDMVPFYYQKEPGNFTLEVKCPHCGKTWYVVWDENPGPIDSVF